MRQFLVGLLTFLLMLPMAVAAPEISWQTYENPAYGYSVDLPLGLFTGSSNGDRGVTLLENEGRGQIDVYGALNVQDMSPREFERELSKADRIREVTYSRRGASWFVISGYYRREGDESDDLIFYAKFMFSADGRVLAAFEASYPRSDKRRFDPIIERMEDSLSSPSETASQAR
jgi:hypothetical protein